MVLTLLDRSYCNCFNQSQQRLAPVVGCLSPGTSEVTGCGDRLMSEKQSRVCGGVWIALMVQ